MIGLGDGRDSTPRGGGELGDGAGPSSGLGQGWGGDRAGGSGTATTITSPSRTSLRWQIWRRTRRPHPVKTRPAKRRDGRWQR